MSQTIWLTCAEHQKYMPHWGCQESADRVQAAGMNGSHWTEPHLTHPFQRYEPTGDSDRIFGSAIPGGACGWLNASRTPCGYPEGAHLVEADK